MQPSPSTLREQLLHPKNDAVRRRALAKAITLTESTKPEHHQQAQALLNSVLPETGRSWRIGITGTPGVGKSTFIEAFGLFLLGLGKKVAVLAVDPSSPIRGGSILGDKTRMEKLAREDNAFIRPSPADGALGGVAQKTRESMLLCEAAGYDIVLVETVGVGQSEYEVASMVDFFLVLMQPNAGDDLQGIKRGIMELADALVINKADGDSLKQAEQTKGHYQNALHLMRSGGAWEPKALTCSALETTGIENVWTMLQEYFSQARDNGTFDSKRRKQNEQWMNSLIQQLLLERFESDIEVKNAMPNLKTAVLKGKITPFEAALTLVKRYHD
jgi:GTPase